MAYIVGLTGQSGAGKTTICEVFAEHGFGVIDCDKLAHTVMNQADCLNALVNVFSGDIIAEDGTLNRKSLGKLVFADKQALSTLNQTAHPFIMVRLGQRIEELSVEKAVIIVDAPTLFESGADKLCDKIVGVIANRETLLARICERDSITYVEGERRLNSQKSDDFFRSRCDIIVENSGDIDKLKKKADNVAYSLENGDPDRLAYHDI